ncbi:MAG: winged helix-turn-helix domain-containing protein [Candidatus Pacearchaeota archaeon]|jgi:predicted transcriptional regulator
MAKKRERLDIIKDILYSIRNNRNIKPTRLLYSSNLSPQMFKDYINELIAKGFISLEIDKDEKKTFSLTQKGNNFLEEYRVIERFVENFGL